MLKLLYPIGNAAGLGEYKIASAATAGDIEGGKVGFITTQTLTSADKDFIADVKERRAVVDICPGASCTAANMSVVGLLDDSESGAGYGTLYGSYGPGTTVASGKATLHVLPGLYMTNLFDTAGFGAAAALATVNPGTALYSLATTALVTTNTATGVTIGNFVEVVRLRDLYRVSADQINGTYGSTGDTFVVLKFK